MLLELDKHFLNICEKDNLFSQVMVHIKKR
jgi:hypothetical protein